MDAVSPSAFNLRVEWYRGRGFWFDPPTARIERGEVVVRIEGEQWERSAESARFKTLGDFYDVEARLEYDPLVPSYRLHIHRALKAMRQQRPQRLGALLLEPVVMGAGGMLFVDPLFQRLLVDMARSGELLEAAEGVREALPVIFDEVFVGLRRIGPMSASAMLGVKPDIACYAKVLTGGLVPMAVTLASEPVFDAFRSPRKVDALLHGHSCALLFVRAPC